MTHDTAHDPEVRAALRTGRPGAIVRAVRHTRHLTLAQLAARCHTSGSHLSRLERGRRGLRNVDVLRELATALEIPPSWLGVADPPRACLPTPRSRTTLHGILPPETEADRMRRRTLLVGATALAGTAVLGTGQAQGRTLEHALLNFPAQPGADPLTKTQLTRLAEKLRAEFAAGRYQQVADHLPAALAAVAHADRHLAELWTLASEIGVKLGNDLIAWTAADRAMQAATRAGDQLAHATASRSWAIALRRAGHRELANRAVLEAAAALQPELHHGPGYLLAYSALTSTAAYSAAGAGDRDAMNTLLTEAADTAEHLDEPARVAIQLYRVSSARVYGDYGTALDTARRIDPATIPAGERRARHWANVARALHAWNRPTDCYRALLAAEHAAPDEVRYRPPIQAITRDLLRSTTARTLPGLPQFAHRTGVTT
ncbi:helix-turn-helix domain-containing protein [Amycolatopsis sp. NPDC059021]|uniref:helix-turn-helix domain-containing protein n=1 Tax=Amycolatopsis sp. NPDC059021 TaxID=3346704 RepID=UPI00366D39CE